MRGARREERGGNDGSARDRRGGWRREVERQLAPETFGLKTALQVQRAARPQPRLAQNMRVNLSRRHILVSQQFLRRADK